MSSSAHFSPPASQQQYVLIAKAFNNFQQKHLILKYRSRLRNIKKFIPLSLTKCNEELNHIGVHELTFTGTPLQKKQTLLLNTKMRSPSALPYFRIDKPKQKKRLLAHKADWPSKDLSSLWQSDKEIASIDSERKIKEKPMSH